MNNIGYYNPGSIGEANLPLDLAKEVFLSFK